MLKLFVLVSVLAASAYAGEWETGVLGGYGWAPNLTVKSPAGSADTGVKPGGGIGVFAGNDSYNYWSGEIRYFVRDSDLKLSSGSAKAALEARAHTINGDFLWHFRPRTSRMRPFFAFGGGIKIFEGVGNESASQQLGRIEGLTSTRQLLPVGDVGFGVKYNLGKHARVRVEVRDYVSPAPSKLLAPAPGGSLKGWVNDITGLVGLSYTW